MQLVPIKSIIQSVRAHWGVRARAARRLWVVVVVGLVAQVLAVVGPVGVAPAGAVTPYEAEIIGRGFDAYFRLDASPPVKEPGGLGTVTSLSASGVTPNQPSALLNDTANKSYGFNGSSSVVKFDGVGGDRTQVAVEAWVKSSTTPSGDTVVYGEGQAGSANDYGVILGVGANGYPFARVGLQYAGSYVREVRPTISVTDGQWHQIAIAYDSASSDRYIRFFIDGRPVKYERATQPSFSDWRVKSYTGFPEMRIGAIYRNSSGTDTNFFNGLIDEVSIYSAPLSPQEVYDSYVASGRQAPPLTPQELRGLGSPSSEHPGGCDDTGDPCDATSGNFSESFTDIGVPGRGAGLGVSRSYNSNAGGELGWFGYGWASNWDMRLILDSSGKVSVREEGGTVIEFFPTGNASTGAMTYTTLSRVLATLVRNSDDSFTFVRRKRDTFGFTTAGRLASVTDWNGYATTLTYTGSSSVTVSETGATGSRSSVFALANNKVSSVTDPAGRVVSYTYANGSVGGGAGDDLVSVTDVRGKTWTFAYDASHRMTSMKDPLNHETTNTYDSSTGRVTSQRLPKNQPSGPATSFAYSVGSSGEGISTVTDAEGRVSRFEHQGGFVTKITRGYGTADAGVWLFEYDPVTGGVSERTDPNGFAETWVRNPSGLVTSHQRALHAAETFTYDSATGAVLTSTDASGVTTTFTYKEGSSNRKNLTKISTPLVGGSQVQEIQFQRSDASHPDDVTAVIDARAKTTTNVYDAYGQLTSTTSPEGNETEYGLDPAGRVVWTKSPLGHRSATVYDNAGLPLVGLNANGNPIVDSFNRPNGALTTTETGEGWSDLGGGSMSVSVEGSQAKLTSGSGPSGAVVTATPHGAYGIVLGDNANGAGLIFRASDPSNYWKLVAVPAANRFELYKVVGGVTTSMGNTGTGTCCTAGQQAVMGMFGSTIVGWVDGIGKFWFTDTDLVSNTKHGVLFGSSSAGKIDAFFEASASSFVDGPEVATAAFDAAGNQTRSTDGQFRSTYTSYNANNEPTGVTRYDTSTLAYGYDNNGLRTSYTDAAGANTTWTYDNQNRLKTMTRPGKSAESYAYTYSSSGEQRVTTRPGGGTITTTMDHVGRPETINYSDTTPDVTLTHDALDRVTAMATGSSNSTWTYDSLGRLKTSARAGRSMAYGYSDLSSNVTSITYPGNLTAAQAYDDDSRMISVTDWNSRQVTFGYDDDSNMTTTSYPGSVVTTRTFNPAGMLRGIDHKKSGTSFATYGYTRGKDDRLGSTTTNSGTPEPYSYDTLARLTGDGTNTWAYDPADNPTQRNTTQQKFNSAGEICWSGIVSANNCATPPTGATTYTHDARGNRTQTAAGFIVVNHGYDLANRLTSLSGAITATYTYDGDNLRTSKTSGTTTPYTWLEHAGRPLLAREGTDNYLYDPLGQPIARINDTGTTRYLHADQIGSTRKITDTTGTTVGTYDYDPYGVQTAHTGENSNLQYTGAYKDTETGYYYLQNRYYDPNTRLFLTVDPLITATGTPYNYADNDPLNKTDPTGNCVLCEFSIRASIGGAIQGAGSDFALQLLGNIANGCDLFQNIDRNSLIFSAVVGGVSAGRVGGRGTQGIKSSRSPGSRIYRALGPDELTDLVGSGKYRNAPGLVGKYFSPTRQQAENFAAAMAKRKLGGPYCITSGCIPASVLSQVERITVGGEGVVYFVPERLLPYIDDIIIHGQ